MKRRGFFGKLVALLGLSALPIRTTTNSCDPFASPGMDSCTVEEGPPVNIAELLPYPPGTLKLGKAKQNPDGTWTIPFEYRAGTWTEVGALTPLEA